VCVWVCVFVWARPGNLFRGGAAVASYVDSTLSSCVSVSYALHANLDARKRMREEAFPVDLM